MRSPQELINEWMDDFEMPSPENAVSDSAQGKLCELIDDYVEGKTEDAIDEYKDDHKEKEVDDFDDEDIENEAQRRFNVPDIFFSKNLSLADSMKIEWFFDNLGELSLEQLESLLVK